MSSRRLHEEPIDQPEAKAGLREVLPGNLTGHSGRVGYVREPGLRARRDGRRRND